MIEASLANSYREYDLYTEGQFDIIKVSRNKLHLINMFERTADEIIAQVPEAISDSAKKGWSVYLELGKENNEWYIIGSGSVTPV